MEITSVELNKIDASEVEKIYSGKPGCMCGCRGKYYEDAAGISRVLKNMKRYVTEHSMRVKRDDYNIYIDDRCSRYYCIYLKRQ